MNTPILQLRALRKSFGALVVADGIDLGVQPGEIHALIGPNGAGKTTLVHQVAGTLVPDSGSVLLGGQDVTRLPPQARARAGLARSFQITSVIPGLSARANVALAVQAQHSHALSMWRRADASAQDEMADAVLARVGLGARATAPAAALAHGEKRALEVAMALAARPRLILLDEPLAGMGRAESHGMIRLLASLKGQVAMLLVEHDMQAVFALADTVSVLVAGRVIASGTLAEVQRNPAVRAAYLGEGAAMAGASP